MARVAFIVDQMFEDSEFRIPYERITQAGHTAVVIGVDREKPIAGKKGQEHVTPDKSIDEVSAGEFDALVIPGGYSPDHLRMNRRMVGLTRDLFLAGKPVAAVCHAGVDAGRGRHRRRAHGHVMAVDQDRPDQRRRALGRSRGGRGRQLITARKPADLEAFSKAVLRQLEHGAPEAVPKQRSDGTSAARGR